MEYTTKRTLKIRFEINSSELIMLQNGGAQIYTYKNTMDDDSLGRRLLNELDDCDEFSVIFQLDGSEKSRYDFINKEANKHLEREGRIKQESAELHNDPTCEG